MYIWQGDTQNDVTGECCQHKTWFNPAINVRKALHVILTKQKPLTAYCYELPYTIFKYLNMKTFILLFSIYGPNNQQC